MLASPNGPAGPLRLQIRTRSAILVVLKYLLLQGFHLVIDIVAAAGHFPVLSQVLGRHLLGGTLVAFEQYIDFLVERFIFQHKPLVFLHLTYVACFSRLRIARHG
jgi:hypothetical protein